MTTETKTPILDRLLADGTIFIDHRAYVGVAADGVEVQLGEVGSEARIEGYLASYPTPDLW